jgi:hypothetical protein
MEDLFLLDSSLKEHYENQCNNYNEYISNFILIKFKYKITLSTIKNARILSCALFRNDKILSKFLLNECDYKFDDILKTCQLLDSNRLCNQMSKKLSLLKNKKKISRFNSIISNLKCLNEEIEVSLSKTKIQFIINEWVQNLSENELEQLCIKYDKKTLRNLFNLLHTKDADFKLSWFNNYLWDKNIPTDCIISKINNLNKSNICDFLFEIKLSYKFLKNNYNKLINEDVLKIIAKYEEFYIIFQHLDIFKNCFDVILDRLKTEKNDMKYGEILKYLQDLEPSNITDELIKIANNKRRNYNINIEYPIAILGDASGSMEIAIKTSTIIMSLLSFMFECKLHLFRNKDEPIPSIPSSIEDIINFSKNTYAGGSTSPASSLEYFLNNKEIIKTFIIITDEEENTNSPKGYSFASVLKEYYKNVYKSDIIFISFLPNRKDGQMTSILKNTMPDIKLKQFLLNRQNPDLKKLDEIFNKLTIQNNSYKEELNGVKKYLLNDIFLYHYLLDMKFKFL